MNVVRSVFGLAVGAALLVLAGCSSDSAKTAVTTVAAPSTVAATVATAATSVPGTEPAPVATASVATAAVVTTVVGAAAAPAETASAGSAPAMSDEERVAYETLAESCVYDADASACTQITEQYGYGATGNYGLGNGLTQAPTDALATECAAFRFISCAELRTRFAIGGGDEAVANTFANAVMAGDAGVIATTSAPRAAAVVTAGPFPAQTVVPVPNVIYDPASGSFQFTTEPTVYYTCWVGDGLVQFCRPEAD